MIQTLVAVKGALLIFAYAEVRGYQQRVCSRKREGELSRNVTARRFVLGMG